MQDDRDFNDLVRTLDAAPQAGPAPIDALVAAAEREVPVPTAATEGQLTEAGLGVLRTLAATYYNSRDDARSAIADASKRVEAMATAYRNATTEVDALLLQIGTKLPHGTAADVKALIRNIRTAAKRQKEANRTRVPVKGKDGPDPAVWDKLTKTESGAPVPGLLNVVTVLEEDPLWRGTLRWNDFASRPELVGEPPVESKDGQIANHTEAEIAIFLEDRYSMRVATSLVHEAIGAVAHRHAYHPVRDYLRSVKWDGVERLPGMLSRWFGVAPSDDGLDMLMGQYWMVAAVARVFEPGCKVDTMLVLCGDQGARKSSALEALAGQDWFLDSPVDIGEKDGMAILQGAWIVELAELDVLSRKEMSTIKAFLTNRVDRYRPVWERNTAEVPRQCVFAGTINGDLELRDPTGSRRFWVRQVVRELDVEGILEHRDQLWAEAVVRFDRGEQWWMSKEADEARAQDAEQYQAVDPWQEPILAWVSGRTYDLELVTIAEEALDLAVDRIDRRVEMRIAQVLRGAGWTTHRKRGPSGSVLRVWRGPGPGSATG